MSIRGAMAGSSPLSLAATSTPRLPMIPILFTRATRPPVIDEQTVGAEPLAQCHGLQFATAQLHRRDRKVIKVDARDLLAQIGVKHVCGRLGR
ncbi:MAG: hypothetical protein L0H73_17875 [Nitrococcus sp.]|nr:hypothetical protein [Nitrococcus sp.]